MKFIGCFLRKVVMALLASSIFTGVAMATSVEKINVGIGYMEVLSTGGDANKVIFNLTLQEQIAGGAYPYVVYSSDCANGISLDISATGAATNMLFSTLLMAKQGMNYVDVRYDNTEGVCTLKAITIKYKQN